MMIMMLVMVARDQMRWVMMLLAMRMTKMMAMMPKMLMIEEKASRTKDAIHNDEEDAKDGRVVTDVRWSGWVGFLTKGLTDEQIGR